jgi:tetratricopeptide (TPR) repeat protein
MRFSGLILWLAVWSIFACQPFSMGQEPPPFIPQPVEPRGFQPETRADVEAYRRLPSNGSFRERLAAYQSFVDQFPGSQLALRAMRELVTFYLLQEKSSSSDPLAACAEWLGLRLAAPDYAWNLYAGASDSLMSDRVETQVTFARILSGVGRYDDALSALAEALVEGEARQNLWMARPDLKEQIDFARSWCFHGKKDYRTAASSYQRFIEEYPTSDYMPAALRNAAMSLNALDPSGAQDRILIYLTRLKEDYPKSAEAADPDVARLLGSQ